MIVFFLCFFACFAAVAKSVFVDSARPPPGFELENVSQHLRLSVLFLHQRIGVFHMELHHGRLTFHDTEELLSKLRGIKKEKAVLNLLNRSFSLNIECLSNGMATLPDSCKQLQKEPIYIIYNPREEIVYLYLAPAYFQKPKVDGAIDFIPNSTSGFSYLNKLGGAGSFSSRDPLSWSQIYSSLPNYYNLYSNNIVAYGNSSIIGNFSQNNGINNGQFFQIQNLYYQTISQDKIYSSGYIVNPVSPFFQTQIIAGAGVKSTLETVKNADSILASPLVIFVPQASQVSIFKNEQLIFSQYLSAGYQNINTNGFPDGGYELLIKIGSSNSVRRFFSKGFFLPPIQAPQYYVIGGYVTNGMILNDTNYNYLPDILNIPVLQAGLNKRINERLAVLTDVLIDSHQGLIDFGPIFFIGHSFIKTTALIGSKGNYGFYTMFNTQMKRLNFNVTATKIVYQDKKQNYFFLNNLIDNDSASLSYRLTTKDLLGIQANYNNSLSQPTFYGAGTYYQRQLWNYKGLGFFLNAAYNKAIYVGNSYSVSLSMNFSEGAFAGTEAISWQNQSKETPLNRLATPMVVQGSTVYSHQNELGLGYSLNETHTFSPTLSSIAGVYDYTASNGFVSTYANYNQAQGQGRSMGYGGSLETEIAVNLNGVRLNGVERGNTAGIIIQVDSSNKSDKTARFALLDANNRRVAVIPANKKIFVSLPGFTDENYTLVNLSSVDYLIKEATQHITLYPGNVDYYSWRAEQRIIVMGRAMRHDKQTPLTNTWIYAGAKNGIFSDKEGYFQLELAQDTAALAADYPDACRILLPKLNVNKVYIYLGEVACS